MLATDLVVGRAYAERAKPNDAECALRKIIFVGPARAGKAKIRHADGDLDGLEEWVPTRTLRCPWGERQAFLRDESRWNALQEAAAGDYDPEVEEAISTVFEATGRARRLAGSASACLHRPSRAAPSSLRDSVSVRAGFRRRGT